MYNSLLMSDCANCHQPLSPERLLAMPGETWCAKCVEMSGDVERITGYMSWAHKTAPELILGRDAELLRPYDRRGFHASLPLNSKNNPRMIQSVESTKTHAIYSAVPAAPEPEVEPVFFNPARCHPNKPRITPKGLCLDCALAWYKQPRIPQ